MHEMYDRLSEKDKRLYAGVEALKLPYGGVSYVAELFGCSRNTVMRGIIELGGQECFATKYERCVPFQSGKWRECHRYSFQCPFRLMYQTNEKGATSMSLS